MEDILRLSSFWPICHSKDYDKYYYGTHELLFMSVNKYIILSMKWLVNPHPK